MNITCRPISSWPWPETPAAERKRAQFKKPGGRNYAGTYVPRRPTPVGQTITELKRELAHLGAEDAVLELDLTERDIRLDGWPRSDARSRSPRVVLSLPRTRHGPLRYGTDRYDRWEDNLRAIRLSLEALRAVDRYGVTRRGEQYAGWKALPPAAGASVTVTAHEAADILASHAPGFTAEDVLAHPWDFEGAHRMARKATHPDRNAGDQRRWDEVERAAEVLRRHHRVAP